MSDAVVNGFVLLVFMTAFFRARWSWDLAC
jgi:hypothetical protein